MLLDEIMAKLQFALLCTLKCCCSLHCTLTMCSMSTEWISRQLISTRRFRKWKLCSVSWGPWSQHQRTTQQESCVGLVLQITVDMFWTGSTVCHNWCSRTKVLLNHWKVGLRPFCATCDDFVANVVPTSRRLRIAVYSSSICSHWWRRFRICCSESEEISWTYRSWNATSECAMPAVCWCVPIFSTSCIKADAVASHLWIQIQKLNALLFLVPSSIWWYCVSGKQRANRRDSGVKRYSRSVNCLSTGPARKHITIGLWWDH